MTVEEAADEDNAEQAPHTDVDPLAYERGDRVGLCLDLDGTIYRDGSVFVEALAFLPYADGVTLTSAERGHRRAALAAVADYHGGRVATAKWRGVLAGLDALHAIGAGRLSETVLGALARRRADREPRADRQPESRTPSSTGTPSAAGPATASETARYETMREAVLSAYGALVRGRRRADVADAVAGIVERRCPVDPRLHATLDRLARRADVDLYLVTDAPDHVAAAYARKVSDAARMVGTTYATDEIGRFTGTFDRVDKGRMVARLRAERGWAYVLAAGDAPVDAAMADGANLYLSVAGQGGQHHGPSGRATVPLSNPDDLRGRLGPERTVVCVPHDEAFVTALQSVLRAVGISTSEEG